MLVTNQQLMAAIEKNDTIKFNGYCQLSGYQLSLKCILCSTEERNSYWFGTT